MTGMIANLLLNIIMVALLGVTIFYCWILNRRIKVLQDSRSELAQLLGHFDESTQRASESIIALQTASKKIGENIQFRIDKANFLIDDLSFMIEKGNKLANQMEAGIAVGRARNRVMSEQPPPAKEEPLPAPVQTQAAETPLRNLPGALIHPSSLERIFEKVVERARPGEGAADRGASREQRNKQSRSKAEQELLNMIKGGIKG